jgi:hypothetical protein
MAPSATSKATLVTIVCATELEDRLAEGFGKLGFVTGYTTTSAGGRGLHGPRQRGFFDGGNLRIEILVTPAHAETMMEFLTAEFGDDALMAFAHDVDALVRHPTPK